MAKHNKPRTPTARVCCLPNLGWAVNVTTGDYTFIGHLTGWVESEHSPNQYFPNMSIHTIEVYKLDRNGIECFDGYASDRVKSLLIVPMLAAAERCRTEGAYARPPAYRPAPHNWNPKG